ncbi:MAG TPA: tetratricopeptide repeat protein, partial [Gemmatimonadales bacterium]|nr:tetratricopeptide repeat protein [Gemmatimonadales bacterium]
LSATDRVVVAAFDAGTDSSLGSTIAEAVKANLLQSSAVHVMPTDAVVATLELMQKPDTARVDYATAREIAQRAGAKAVVTGSIVPAGSGYVITERLVEATTGNDLASYTESARDAGDLIPAVDRVTKSLRRKIGESLKSVQAAPRLDQVTTASLDALKSYTDGLFANDVRGDYPAAIQHFRDAVRQDSTFAMAWVQLSYSLSTLGGAGSEAAAEAALTRSFQLRNRLPERERANVEGAYYWLVVHDRRKAITAFRRAVELDSTNLDAMNSLALALSDIRDYEDAVPMLRRAIARQPRNGTMLVNLATLYSASGRQTAFDSIMAEVERDSIPFPVGRLRYGDLLIRHDYDGAEKVARVMVDSGPAFDRGRSLIALANVLLLRGRVRQAELAYSQGVDATARIRGDTLDRYTPAFWHARVDGELLGNRTKAIALLDSTVRAYPVESQPAGRDLSQFVALEYALLGDAAKARSLMSRHMARLDSLGQRREYIWMMWVNGAAAMAEGKMDSAIVYYRRADFGADGLPAYEGPLWLSLNLGRAFDRTGQADSARKYLTQYAEMAGIGHGQADPIYMGPALLRLGQLYQDIGDTTRAMRYYGRLVNLWKNADPELQPRVTEAKKAMAELRPDQGRS